MQIKKKKTLNKAKTQKKQLQQSRKKGSGSALSH